MAFRVPNLAYLRNIPVIGGRLYEALHGAQQAINTMAEQGNLNPDGTIDPPPALQGVTATGANGVLHVSIEHTAADLRRGAVNYIEHADNPSFINPQIRPIGDSRSFSEFVGNQARYVRAYNAYPSGDRGPILYHGGAATPQPVNAGGAIGPAPYLPSTGSGTGAAGQGGVGPGPVPVRSDANSFNWKLQRPIASESLSRAASPGSQGFTGASGSGGGGGIVTQPEIFGTHANRLTLNPLQYATNTFYYETDRTVTYWVQPASGTVTVTGGINVAWVSGSKFNVLWPSLTVINIDGNPATIFSVNSTTSITLALPVANGVALSYSVTNGAWKYFTGEYSDVAANVPIDLVYDDAGFRFFENAVFFHQSQWVISLAWKRGPEDLDRADTFHEFGDAPAEDGWHACDGSATTYYDYVNPDTPISRTLPNSNATPSYARGGNAYSATITAAEPPTIGGITEDTAIGFTPAAAATASTGTAAAGAGQAVLTALTSGGGGGSLGTDPHHHALTSVNAPISLAPGDPVPHFEIVRMYRR